MAVGLFARSSLLAALAWLVLADYKCAGSQAKSFGVPFVPEPEVAAAAAEYEAAQASVEASPASYSDAAVEVAA